MFLISLIFPGSLLPIIITACDNKSETQNDLKDQDDQIKDNDDQDLDALNESNLATISVDSFSDYDDDYLKSLGISGAWKNEMELYLQTNFDSINLNPINSFSNVNLTYVNDSITLANDLDFYFYVSATTYENTYWDLITLDNSVKQFQVNFTAYAINQITIEKLSYTQTDGDFNQTISIKDIEIGLQVDDNKLVYNEINYTDANAATYYEYSLNSLTASLYYDDSDFNNQSILIEQNYDFLSNNKSTLVIKQNESEYVAILTLNYNDIAFEAYSNLTYFSDYLIRFNEFITNNNNSLYTVNKSISKSNVWTNENDSEDYTLAMNMLSTTNTSHIAFFRQISSGSIDVEIEFSKTDANSWTGYLTFGFNDHVFIPYYWLEYPNTSYTYYSTSNATISFGSETDINNANVSLTNDFKVLISDNAYTINSVEWFLGQESLQQLTITLNELNQIIIKGPEFDYGSNQFYTSAKLDFDDLNIKINTYN